MPLSTETIVNKPLSGAELLECVLNDLRELLSRDAMFGHYIAYGQTDYTVGVELRLNNISYPRHKAQRQAAQRPSQGIGPVEAPEATATLSRERRIESPNAARLLNKLPVERTFRQDGRLVTREVDYQGAVQVPPQPEPIDTCTAKGVAAEVLAQLPGKLEGLEGVSPEVAEEYARVIAQSPAQSPTPPGRA